MRAAVWCVGRRVGRANAGEGVRVGGEKRGRVRGPGGQRIPSVIGWGGAVDRGRGVMDVECLGQNMAWPKNPRHVLWADSENLANGVSHLSTAFWFVPLFL